MRPTAATGEGERGPFWVPSPRLATQYVAISLTWGASFLFIKIGLEGLLPAQLVLARLIAGATTLGVISLVSRRRLPSGGKAWVHLLVVALLLCDAPFLLIATAEQHLSSGMASICNASTPLMTTIATFAALRSERPRRSQLLGLAVGFLGVWLALGPTGSLGPAALECLLAAACYGAGFVYLRRFVSPLGLHPVSVATAQVGIAAVVMIATTSLMQPHAVRATPQVLIAVSALGVLSTGLAWVWNANIVAGWGATAASTVTYMTPLVALALGLILLREGFHWNEPIGALAVIFGTVISSKRLGSMWPRSNTMRNGREEVPMPAEQIAVRPGSTETATHYRWGGCCDGWRLLDESGVSVNEERVPPGRGEVWHSHDEARQFFYILDGEAEIRTGRGTAVLKAGEGAEVPPGLPHRFFNAGPAPVRFLVVSAPSARSDRRLLEARDQPDDRERDDRPPPAGSSLK